MTLWEIWQAMETKVKELEAENERAKKALREIGERAIVDWQDELVGLVSVGLGTTDWDSVTTMERHVVRAEQARRHAAEAENERLQAQQEVPDILTLLPRKVTPIAEEYEARLRAVELENERLRKEIDTVCDPNLRDAYEEIARLRADLTVQDHYSHTMAARWNAAESRVAALEEEHRKRSTDWEDR